MASSSISNSFVVTGIFNATTMIAQVNAALARIDTSLTTSFARIGTNINSAINQGTGAAVSNVSGIGTAMQRVGQGSGTVNRNLANTNKEVNAINSGILTAVKRVVLWGAASRLVFNSFQKINDSIQDTIRLNKLLVDIQKIRPTGFKVSAIKANVLKSAIDYGVAFEEIGETQRLFFQQGFKTNEVLALSQAQLLGVAASGLSATESMELLISAMSVFGRQANEAVLILDKLQQVQANFAIGTQDIASAMRRVGPVVESVGGNLDNLIGIITALKTTTRKSGEFIGTALSTIFSRVFTPTGENALRKVGVYINESALAIRPLNDILDEVAVKWETLNNVEKKNLALALGARRRFPQVLALFDSYSIATEAAAVSAESFGAAIIAQEKELGSISRQMSILTETSRAFGLSFLEAMSPSGDSDQDLKQTIKVFQDFFGFLNTHKNTIANTLKVTGVLAGIIAVVPAIRGVFLSLSALQVLTVRAVKPTVTLAASVINMGRSHITAVKQIASMNVALAKGTATMSAYRFSVINTSKALSVQELAAKKATVATISWGAAMRNAIPIIGTVVAVLSTLFILNKIKNTMEDTSIATKDMTDTFKGMGAASDELKKSLQEYYAVSKQFRSVGGSDDFTKFNKVVTEFKRSGEDISAFRFKDLAFTLKEMGFEAGSAGEELAKLNTVIGFMKSVRGGAGRVLEKMTEDINGVTSELLQFSSSLNRISDAGFEPRIGLSNVYDELFGDYKGREKDIKDSFAKIYSAIDNPDLHKTGPSIDILSDRLIGGSDGLLKDLQENYGELGQLVARRFVENLGLSLRSGQVRGVYSPDMFSPKKLAEAFETAVSEATSPDVLERALRQNLIKSKIDIFEFLRTKDSEGITSGLNDQILKLQLGAQGLQEKFSQDFLSKYTEDLVALRNAMSVASDGTIDLAKKMTKLYLSSLQYLKNTNLLGVSLQKATQKALVFGQSLPQKQLSVYNKLIKEGLDVLSEIRTLNTLIKANEEHEKTLRASAAAIQAFSLIKLKDNVLAQKQIDLADKTRQETVDLKAAVDDLGGSEGDITKKIELQVIAAKNLLAVIRASTDAYKRGTDSVKLYSKDMSASIKLAEKYAKAQIKINKTVADTRDSGDRAKLLQNEIDVIREIANIQFQTIRARIVASKQEYKEVVSLINLKKQSEQIGKDDLENIQKFTGVYDALSTSNEKLLDKASRKHDIEQKGLLTQQSRLKLDLQQQESLAIQTAYMNELKEIQGDINSLASSYAGAFTDVLRDVGELIGKRGALRDVISGFADAYVDSISSSMERGLTEAFKGISANTIGRDIEELEKKIKSEQTNQTNQAVYDAILSGHTVGGRIAGDYITQAFRDGASHFASINVAVPTTTTTSGQVLGAVSPSVTSATLTQSPGYQQISELNSSVADLEGGFKNYALESKDNAIEVAKADLASAKATQFLNSTMQVVGNAIGQLVGGGGVGANLGAGVGGSLGSILGPVGGMVGSIVGGIFGGFFDKDPVEEDVKEDPVLAKASIDAITENTRALIQNSQSFDFMKRLINAPSNYIGPATASLGGGYPAITVEINAPVGNEEAVATAVGNAVAKVYSNDERRIGRRG